MVWGTVRPRRKEASEPGPWLVPGEFMFWRRGLMLLFPQNVLSVAGDSLGFVALGNWACVCFVQRCNKTPPQFN